MDQAEILQAIKARKGFDGFGVATAYDFLSTIEPCLNGGLCPIKTLNLKNADQWAGAVAAAKHSLVWTPRERKIGHVLKAAEAKKLHDGAIMEFDCVITTNTPDRQGDVLESKGAIVDPNQPLLWQHCPFEPIGKMVAVIKQNSRRVAGRFAIADVPLGRDAATLIDFGALRISHGFRPIKWESIKEKDDTGGEYFVGYRFLEFEIMETSVVSVPANPDAVITAYQHEKLEHPLVKSWAHDLFSVRPTIVKSVEIPKVEEPPVESEPPAETETKDAPACGCKATKHEAVIEVKMGEIEFAKLFGIAGIKTIAEWQIAKAVEAENELALLEIKRELKHLIAAVERGCSAIEERKTTESWQGMVDVLAG